MIKKYFGTDGVRGRFSEFPITKSFIFSLALALGESDKNVKKVLIGRDTRISGKKIEEFLCAGFKKLEIKCDFIGIVSTPMISFYTKKLKYDFGIMISASHNPYFDNGIKIFKKNGEKLEDEEELNIEKKIDKNLVESVDLKKVNEKIISFHEYENFLTEKFNNLMSSDLKVFVDCANGSLYKFAPYFLKKIGVKVTSYATKPNGININDRCGAMYPNNLSKLTLKNKADIGISFDGDADRVIVSDEQGNILDGDILMAVICSYEKRKKGLIKSVVTTKMSNLSFREYISSLGIEVHLSDVGDRNVIQKMKDTRTSIGGEPSGHLVFSDNGYCGDGLLTSLYLISILLETRKKVSYFYEHLFLKNSQHLVNLKTKKCPQQILDDSKLVTLKRKVISKYPNVDFLLRKSGTENLLRVMVQSKDEVVMNKVLDSFINLIKDIDE